MPIKLGVKEVKRNILLYGLSVLLLSVIFVILTFAVAVTRRSTEKYLAIQKLMPSEGGYCVRTFRLINPDDGICISNKRELNRALRYAPQAAGQYMFPEAKVNDIEANVWSYDSEILLAYTPVMEQGCWFKKEDIMQREHIYGVAISAGSIHVGDVVKVTDYNERAFLDVEIIGLIKDSSSVMGYDMYRETSGDYSDYFYIYSLEGEEKPLLILSNDQLDHRGQVESMENTSLAYISRIQYGVYFLSWEDDNEKSRLDDFLSDDMNGMTLRRDTFETVRSGSETVIKEQLYRILPIVVCSFILVLLVTVSVGTVSVKQQLHNYAIYNLCGLGRGQCVNISVAASLICSVLAFVVSHAGMALTMASGMLSETAIEINWYSIGACLAIMVIYTGVSVLIPGIIIRGKTIKTLLITHRE